MKRISVVLVSFPLNQRERWKQIVTRYCDKATWYEPFNEQGRLSVTCKFDTADPRYSSFVTLLSECRLEWSERIEMKYSDSELRASPLLRLSIKRAPLQSGGPSHGTEYELSSACPNCGTGAIQTSPLRLPLNAPPKKGHVCQAAFGERLVDAELAQALREAKLSGLELRQVCFYRNDEPLPWWQIMTSFEMPKMAEATAGIEFSEAEFARPCSVCGRDGRFHMVERPVEIIYSTRCVNAHSVPDFAHTWECFGKSRIDMDNFKFSSFARPELIVKPQVMDIFQSLKVKHAWFDPVRVD